MIFCILHYRLELVQIHKALIHRIISSIFYNINGRLTFLFIYLPYALMGFPALPEVIFPVLACCNNIRVTVVLYLMASISTLTDIYVAMQRIQVSVQLNSKHYNQIFFLEHEAEL